MPRKSPAQAGPSDSSRQTSHTCSSSQSSRLQPQSTLPLDPSTTPRKSSIRSTRTARSHLPPLSLRAPASRIVSPSAASLSLIFASSDRSVGGQPTISSNGRTTSEEVLAKQLDGDAGGKTMGLRNRTGSQGTVRTSRTYSGASAESLREEAEGEQGSATEEGEEVIDQAGPSTRRSRSPTVHAGAEEEVQQAREQEDAGAGIEVRPGGLRLNPKSSSSWLRWNSPAPAFPRSVSREKGKERARDQEAAEDVPRTESPTDITNDTDPLAMASTVSAVEPVAAEEATFPVAETNEQKATDGKNSAGPEYTTAEEKGDKLDVSSVPAPKGRWWSRPSSIKPPSTSDDSRSKDRAPAGEAVSIESTAQVSAEATDMENPSPTSGPTLAPIPTKQSSLTQAVLDPADLGGSSPDSMSRSIGTAITARESLDAPGGNTVQEDTEDRTKSDSETMGRRGWFGYFGRARNEEAVPSQATEVPPGSPLQTPPNGPNVDETPAEVEDPSSAAGAVPESSETTNSGDAEALAGPTPQSKPGWGTYFYSFVATPAPVESVPDTAVIPFDPAEDQKPASSTPPGPSVEAASPLPTPAAEQSSSLIPAQPGSSPSLASTPTHRDLFLDPERARKTSNASQSGWLNYLAFKASQKKVTNTSNASIKSGKERKSIEGEAREEVMDLSSDPNFPSTSLAVSSSATGSPALDTSAAIGASQPEPDTKEAKGSKEKTLNKKTSQALAVRDRRSSNSSAKTVSQTPLSSSPMPKSSAKAPNSSALPAPPAPAQPNFVIPTFETTFDRPPRSLPPLTEPQAGLTATTTGLAWKALGAVGSYVYGGADSGEETRGMKEGRKVGMELPRKTGLEAKGVGADDGWKNVRRVAVVGVHGWFPAKMLNSVIGEPTGTSVKFANMMAASVKRFFEERGVDDLRITPMPLEGEGTIESRVDRLYKSYLSNPAWINDLRRADAVFFAAHSQGCVVTTHLISRLIAQGHIRTAHNADAVARCEWAFGPIGVIPETRRRSQPIPGGSEGGHQKVAMLAMCGVHLGPLYSISTSSVIQPYLQWFENAAARELFEFQDTTSAVSVAYQKSLSMILENEVKIVLLASYNDQVVPIYGASFSTANHPLLLRALFVDGASYTAADFMTNLLAFAFMLRNAGIDDQQLVEHLSEATAGSLTGVGHSAPYEDKGCYDLTVSYLFLSGPAKRPLPPLHIDTFTARDVKSDFELPWIMRALVDSPEVRDLFPEELEDLREGVLAWKPITKALREIKKRLEPMAGRQSRLRVAASSNSLHEANVAGKGSGPAGLRRDW